jgi:HK97 family phage major capsid protein
MQEFKNIGELVSALYNFEKKHIVDPRFEVVNGRIIKAAGQNELVAVDGGYGVGGAIISPVLRALAQESKLFSKAAKFQSSSPMMNEGWLPYINETDRSTTGMQLRSYWVPEAGDKTTAKFSFGLSKCKLHKIYASLYVTEELWSDSAGFSSAINEFVASNSKGSLIWAVEREMVLGDGSITMSGIMGPDSIGTIGVAVADPITENVLINFNNALAPTLHNIAEWFVSEENYRDIQAINFTNENDKFYKDGELYVMGKKVNVMEQMVTPYDIMLGSPTQYAVALKSGPLVTSDQSIHISFSTDERFIRFGIRINGRSFGQKYTLADSTEVASWVIPESTPAEESSSSSSMDSHSSVSSESTGSSSSSTEEFSHSSSSSSSLSSASSISLSSASSMSNSSISSSSSSSSESSESSTSESSEQSSGWVGPCEESYVASTFAITAINGLYNIEGRHNNRAYYKRSGAAYYIFWSSGLTVWAIATTLGASPANWLSNSTTASTCPNGAYTDESGLIS